MYSYVKDSKLYLIETLSGRVYHVGMTTVGEPYPVVVLHEYLQYHADIERRIKETKATWLMENYND